LVSRQEVPNARGEGVFCHGQLSDHGGAALVIEAPAYRTTKHHVVPAGASSTNQQRVIIPEAAFSEDQTPAAIV
jgi:hypothetical protein